MSRDISIKIWRRTNYPSVVWRFKNKNGSLCPLADSYELSIEWLQQTEAFTRLSPSGLVIDPSAGTVTWPYTADETLLIPLGGVRYELMGTSSGHTRLWAGGTLTNQSFRR